MLAQARARPDLVLCVASGSTLTAAYALLAAEARRQPGLFARARVVQLDEWGGLGAQHPGNPNPNPNPNPKP